jgi:DNA-binding NarL/FixJ family response regulator
MGSCTCPRGVQDASDTIFRVRVLIADDHALFRDGLRSLLEARGVDVLGEARNGREAVDQARRLKPDVVLMDLNMPEMNGLQATRLISVEQPETRVVILTASEDDADLFEAIKSGAQGYLLKNLASADLFRLLDGVARGEPALTPGLARKLLGEFRRPAQAPAAHVDSYQSLTEREREVLDLLVQGITSNRDVAERLVVTENTVKYHFRNILDKLHLQNRAQVVAYAARHGMIDARERAPFDQ